MSENSRAVSTSVLRKRERNRAFMRAQREKNARIHGLTIDHDRALKQLGTVIRRRITLEALLERLREYQNYVVTLEATLRKELDLPGCSTPFNGDLPTLQDAKSAVFGHEFDRAFLKGALRFQFIEADVGSNQALSKGEPTAAPPDRDDARQSAVTIEAWVKNQIEALLPASPGAPAFTETFLQFTAPIFTGGARLAEGIQTERGVEPALVARPRMNEPVQVLIGVPGAGKTHRALQMMSRKKGRIYAFSPTPGSRGQVRQLVDKLGLIDRVKVVEKIGDLRRRSRVLIDEASLVKPGILHYLRDATELYLAGDAGQSAANPGESLLGALAALGAPLIELTESRRTSSPAIKLLGQFVSSTQTPFIPEIERIVPEKAVRLAKCREGEDFDALVAEAAKHEDCIAIVWSQDLQERLTAAGVRAYQANLAQGSEAEHVIVHMPADWSDPAKVPAPPFISFLNGICRAKTGATIVASAEFDAMFYDNALLRQRANDLEIVVDLACDDPRRPSKNPLSRWTEERWRLCELVLNTFNNGNLDADLVGDWLFAYRKSDPTRYCGAALIGPGKMGVTEEMVLARGFPWAESFEFVAGEDLDATKGEVRRRLVAQMVPGQLAKKFDLRNRIAGISKGSLSDS